MVWYPSLNDKVLLLHILYFRQHDLAVWFKEQKDIFISNRLPASLVGGYLRGCGVHSFFQKAESGGLRRRVHEVAIRSEIEVILNLNTKRTNFKFKDVRDDKAERAKQHRAHYLKNPGLGFAYFECEDGEA